MDQTHYTELFKRKLMDFVAEQDPLISDNYISRSYCLMIKSYPTPIVASTEILLSDFLILAQKTTC